MSRVLFKCVDLCSDCTKAYKGRGGCPIWPPLRITEKCVEYEKVGKKLLTYNTNHSIIYA